MLAASLAAADVGQSVVAGLLGLGAAGVAGGVIAMAWSIHMHQIRLAGQLAAQETTAPAENAGPAPAVNGAIGNGNGARHGNGNGLPGNAADSDGVPRQTGYPVEPGKQQGGRGTGAGRAGSRPAQPGPGGRHRGTRQHRHRRAGSLPGPPLRHPAGGRLGSLLAARFPRPPTPRIPMTCCWSPTSRGTSPSPCGCARASGGRETKAVTAVEVPASAAPLVTPRLFLQEWPLVVVAVLIVGFAAALVALGSLAAASFVALVAPMGALLGVLAATRKTGGGGPGDATVRSGQQQPRH